MEAWKFLVEQDGGMWSNSGRQAWQVGQVVSVEGQLEPCSRGLHCSREPLDALRYVPGSIMARVEVVGEELIEHGGDKLCCRSLKILESRRWTPRDSVALAVHAAELVLPVWQSAYPNDDRPAKAIQAARAWMDAGAAAKAAAAAQAAAEAAAEAAAAANAAWAAAQAAAEAARAARAAAEAAANAAWAAAQAAANAAWDAARAAANAAWAAAQAAINRWMLERWEVLERV